MSDHITIDNWLPCAAWRDDYFVPESAPAVLGGPCAAWTTGRWSWRCECTRRWWRKGWGRRGTEHWPQGPAVRVSVGRSFRVIEISHGEGRAAERKSYRQQWSATHLTE